MTPGGGEALLGLDFAGLRVALGLVFHADIAEGFGLTLAELVDFDAPLPVVVEEEQAKYGHKEAKGTRWSPKRVG